MVDKHQIIDEIVSELGKARELALVASDEAHATASNKENAAENKYDTLGLEAAYLAHGQSTRVVQLEKELIAYQALKLSLEEHELVAIGSYVTVEDQAQAQQDFFVGPTAGGLVVAVEGRKVTVITPESPLGGSLLKCEEGDEVSIGNDGSLVWRVVAVI